MGNTIDTLGRYAVDIDLQAVDFKLQPVDFELQPVDFELQPVDFELSPMTFELQSMNGAPARQLPTTANRFGDLTGFTRADTSNSG